MSRFRRSFIARTCLWTIVMVYAPFAFPGDEDPKNWPSERKEQFLLNARIAKSKGAKKGITGTVRVTLDDGTTIHEASVQSIDDRKTVFQPATGPAEVNFRDTYKFNIAAWKLARLLGVEDMVPPSVERKYKGNSASFSWWVDDLMMDEGDRKKKNLNPPDQEAWNREMNVILVLDQLIYNMDRNVGNILIDKQWRLWMIDHSRAFRLHKTLLNPKVLTFCDRFLYVRMKVLDEATLVKELEPYVNRSEIQALLARRDLIVKAFEEKGDKSLYDRPARK